MLWTAHRHGFCTLVVGKPFQVQHPYGVAGFLCCAFGTTPRKDGIIDQLDQPSPYFQTGSECGPLLLLYKLQSFLAILMLDHYECGLLASSPLNLSVLNERWAAGSQAHRCIIYHHSKYILKISCPNILLLHNPCCYIVRKIPRSLDCL
jgi:hypothetical protein